MSNEFSIRPSKDIRTNYPQIAALAHRHPVAITVNGREDTVLMGHEEFMEQRRTIEELQAKLAVYAHLAQSADDVKLDCVQTVASVTDEIIGDIDKL